ncbi:MAG TPA: signal peptidase I [Polyangia bacterium]
MTVAVAPPRYRRGPGPFLRAGLRALLVFAAPAVAALLALRYAFPSRLGGAGGGVAGFFAWVADRHPLFICLALFVALSEVGRYWSQRILPTAATATRGAPAGAPKRRVARLVGALAAAAILAFVVRSSVVATYTVVGPSMLPTLEVGDRVLVNRRAYGTIVPLSKAHLGMKVPARGDLVVFPASGLVGIDGTQEVVKRVVGLPGDTVAYQQGQLIINDWPVPACDAGPYAGLMGRLTVRGRLVMEYLGDRTYLTVRNVIEPPFAGYTVKPGEVFVVGDDRGVSSDSRLWKEGRGAGVPIDLLEGRVTRVLLGARPDGRLDFKRLLAPPLELKVRLPGIDMRETDKRIDACLKRRPAVTSPPSAPKNSRVPR